MAQPTRRHRPFWPLLSRIPRCAHRHIVLLMMAFPPRTAKRWNEHDIDLEVAGEVESVFDGLLKMEMNIDGEGNASPKVLSLMPEAQDAWVAFYDDHAAL